MAQVVTKCRLTGHYLFMGMEADPKEFTRTFGPFARKFCPYCACEHFWHKEYFTPLYPRRPGRTPISSRRADAPGSVETRLYISNCLVGES